MYLESDQADLHQERGANAYNLYFYFLDHQLAMIHVKAADVVSVSAPGLRARRTSGWPAGSIATTCATASGTTCSYWSTLAGHSRLRTPGRHRGDGSGMPA